MFEVPRNEGKRRPFLTQREKTKMQPYSIPSEYKIDRFSRPRDQQYAENYFNQVSFLIPEHFLFWVYDY
jgi:hypothetical protein